MARPHKENALFPWLGVAAAILVVIASPALLGAVGFQRAADAAVFDPILSLCLAMGAVNDPAAMGSAWSFAPQIVLPMLVAAFLYGRGAVSAIRREPAGSPTLIRSIAFFAGLALLAVALVSPLCRMAATLASAHMIQHVIIVAVAPPLLLLGRPLLTILAGIGSSRLDPAAISFVRVDNPGAVALLYGAVIWLSHAPYIYESALLYPTAHLALLGVQIAASLLFWNMQLRAALNPQSQTAGAAVVAGLFTFMHTGLLGALLTFAGQPWYPVFGLGPQAWGLTAMEDQQLAGLIMWVPMAVFYLAAGLAIVGQLLKESDRTSG